jgi:hypothetical protein
MDEVSPIDRLETIIRDIERTVRGFSISGPGVSGHIKDGYIVNARPGVGQSGEGSGGGAPPPEDTCPHAGDATIDFTGITVCPGCINLSGGSPGDTGSIANIIDNGLNGTFTGFLLITGPPADVWLHQGIGEPGITYDEWFTDHACSGTPGFSGSNAPNTWVMCQDRGFKILSQFGGLLFFYTDWITGSPTSVANLAVCGGVVSDPDWDAVLGAATFVGICSGGSATVTIA